MNKSHNNKIKAQMNVDSKTHGSFAKLNDDLNEDKFAQIDDLDGSGTGNLFTKISLEYYFMTTITFGFSF